MEHKVLALDVSVAGCSGDMMLGALAGLLAEQQGTTVEEEMTALTSLIAEEMGMKLTPCLEERARDPVRGYRVGIEEEHQRLGMETLESVLTELSGKLDDKRNRDGVLQALELLVEGEKHVHARDDIHFHELGSLDTVLDLFGVFYFIDRLGVNWINISPVLVGRGSVKTRHGVLPVPAPVTSWILYRGKLETVDDMTVGEMLTPTGATILATLGQNYSRMTRVFWESESYGFGTKSLDDRANAVRARLGTPVRTETDILVLETNIDDIGGEFLGYLTEVLMEQGALDVSYSPLIMKKGRPAWRLQVMCKNGEETSLSETIMRHTGTLGIRVSRVSRHIGRRSEEQTVRFGEETIRIKRGEYSQKLEFEDLKNLSRETGLSPLEIRNLLRKIQDYSEGR